MRIEGETARGGALRNVNGRRRKIKGQQQDHRRTAERTANAETKENAEGIRASLKGKRNGQVAEGRATNESGEAHSDVDNGDAGVRGRRDGERTRQNLEAKERRANVEEKTGRERREQEERETRAREEERHRKKEYNARAREGPGDKQWTVVSQRSDAADEYISRGATTPLAARNYSSAVYSSHAVITVARAATLGLKKNESGYKERWLKSSERKKDDRSKNTRNTLRLRAYPTFVYIEYHRLARIRQYGWRRRLSLSEFFSLIRI